MATPFPRLLVLLRKEKGISQKQAAADLGVSQALLSHYEKGIRQCSLEFVVKTAEYYDVSCDYLLGRTSDKSGAMIAIDSIPSGEDVKIDPHLNGNMLSSLNKKLIFNSINIVFEMLQKYNSKTLTNDVSDYFMIAIYAMFRELYAANPKNPEAMFSEPAYRVDASIASKSALLKAEIHQLASGNSVGEQKGINVSSLEALLPKDLSKEYPMFASSLLNLLKKVEGIF